MNVKKLLAGMWVGALLLGGTAAQAHHSFASVFDSAKPGKVVGKVTNLEWVNPHARFYVDVKNASGRVAHAVTLADGSKVFSGERVAPH